jgi:DNA-binding Xre family transcriptional regulator
MAEMKWNLEGWLEQHGITRYELAQNMGGNVKTRLTSLYRMRQPKRIDLSVMGEIVSALRRITGEEVTPNDLLEYIPDPAPKEMDAETKAWLYAELAPPLEPYDWAGVEPETLGEGRVEYDPEEGFVVVEDAA